jgi:adenylate cyclase
MFTDVVGYSALAQSDERLALRLLADHRVLVRETLRPYRGREIETAGDSFLIEFDSAWSAVRCAIALQKRHAAQNRLQRWPVPLRIRIGVHLGDIEHRGGNLLGDGVNVAARIEPLAPPEGIAVSGYIHAHLQGPVAAAFRSLGPQQLKNLLRPIEVHVVDHESLLALPDDLVTADPGPPLWNRARLTTAAVASVVIVAAVPVLWHWRPMSMPTPLPVDEKSVAVLPFDHLGTADLQYFTDGLQDSLITDLAKIADLKVVSRTSTMGYRDAGRNLRDVARELGVANLVEASVQRVGTRVRINAQLIHATTDTHLWAADYDREIGDVFSMQAAMAEEIATRVHAHISETERSRIEKPRANSTEELDLLLRSQPLADSSTTPAQRAEMARAFNDAVTRDPSFAAGYAELAIWQTHIALSDDPSPERLASARDAALHAIALDPDSANAQLAVGDYYRAAGDLRAGLAAIERAVTLAPGDARIRRRLAITLWRAGEWSRALEQHRISTSLEPRNEVIAFLYAKRLAETHRYTEADTEFVRLLGFAEHPDETAVDRAFYAVSAGRGSAALKALMVKYKGKAGCDAIDQRYPLFALQGRWLDAAQTAAGCAETHFASDYDAERTPWSFTAGLAYRAAGDLVAARRQFALARDRLQTQVDAHADWGLVRVEFAQTLAEAGELDRAQSLVDEALKLKPIDQLPAAGGEVLAVAADFHAQYGPPDRALGELEQVLRAPGASAYDIRQNPAWQHWLADPRFQHVLADHLPPQPID